MFFHTQILVYIRLSDFVYQRLDNLIFCKVAKKVFNLRRLTVFVYIKKGRSQLLLVLIWLLANIVMFWMSTVLTMN